MSLSLTFRSILVIYLLRALGTVNIESRPESSLRCIELPFSLCFYVYHIDASKFLRRHLILPTEDWLTQLNLSLDRAKVKHYTLSCSLQTSIPSLSFKAMI